MYNRKYQREQVVSGLIIAVSAVIFVIVVCFLIFGKKEEADVPEVMPVIVGFSADDVEGCYSRFFTINVTGEEYSDYKSGVILSQSVAAGELYTPGKTVVKVTVSAGHKPEEQEIMTGTAAPVTEILPEETAAPEEERTESMFINNPAMEFEYLSQGDPVSVITIGIDEEDSEMKEALDELYSIVIKRCGDGGFLFVDLDTGASVEYNADEKFSAASIIKAPYVRAVLGSETDLGKTYEMTEEMLNTPSELINGKPVGTEFTISELAEAAVSRSDNTAYKMLYNYIGYECFNELAEALNIPNRMTEDNYWFRLTSRQTAIYFKDIYYFTVQHKNGELLKKFLENSEKNDLYAEALPSHTVCEKYGYLPQEDVGFYTLGDAAIVYDEHPYIIVGYVRGSTSSSALNRQYFRDTAQCAEKIHSILHNEQ